MGDKENGLYSFTAVRVGKRVVEKNYDTIWVRPDIVVHVGINQGGYARLTVETDKGNFLDYHIVGMSSDEVGAILELPVNHGVKHISRQDG